MTLRTLWTLGLIALLGLAGCSSSDDLSTGFGQVSVAAKQAFIRLKAKSTPAQPIPPLTRAIANETTDPLLEVRFERLNARVILFNAGQNGDVQTWRALDNKTISLKNGIIVATRGLGDDLMSAKLPDLSQMIQGGSVYNRFYYYLDGLDRSTNLPFTCRTFDLGPETIVVVERTHQTRHIQETCKGPDAEFVNDYWFENGSYLRQSNQWMNVRLGSVRFSRVND